MFGIRQHCSPFNIIMGLSLAHGGQKRWILATLWPLSHLNLVTTPDKYPLPNVQDLSDGLHGCNVF
jgi:hypothetical protein